LTVSKYACFAALSHGFIFVYFVPVNISLLKLLNRCLNITLFVMEEKLEDESQV